MLYSFIKGRQLAFIDHASPFPGAPDPYIRDALRPHPSGAGELGGPRHSLQPRGSHVRAVVLQRGAGAALRATAAPAARDGAVAAAHDGQDPGAEHAARPRQELPLRHRLHQARHEGALLLAARVRLQQRPLPQERGAHVPAGRLARRHVVRVPLHAAR